MHVGKLSVEPALTSQMYGQRGSGLLQLVVGDGMVHRKNRENASYTLVNIYSFFFSGFWPTDLIAGFLLTPPLSALQVHPLQGSQESLASWYTSFSLATYITSTCLVSLSTMNVLTVVGIVVVGVVVVKGRNMMMVSMVILEVI